MFGKMEWRQMETIFVWCSIVRGMVAHNESRENFGYVHTEEIEVAI